MSNKWSNLEGVSEGYWEGIVGEKGRKLGNKVFLRLSEEIVLIVLRLSKLKIEFIGDFYEFYF